MGSKVVVAFLFALLSAGSANATDITGQWTATVPTPRGTEMIRLDLTENGETLTGFITTQRGQTTLKDCHLDGDELSFTQHVAVRGTEFDVFYTGTVTDEQRIHFTRGRKDWPPVEFTATRVANAPNE